MSVLHVAVTQRHLSITRLLLGRRANVNVQDCSGVTPLMIAADAGNVEMAQLLLGSGAKTEVKDKQEQTALGRAQSRHVTIVNGLGSTRHVEGSVERFAETLTKGRMAVAQLLQAKP